MDDSKKSGGVSKQTGANECIRKYSPTSGGYTAKSLDAGPGPVGGMDADASTGMKSDEGNYETKINSHGNWPHGAEDPEIGGPPLGHVNENDPTKSMY